MRRSKYLSFQQLSAGELFGPKAVSVVGINLSQDCPGTLVDRSSYVNVVLVAGSGGGGGWWSAAPMVSSPLVTSAAAAVFTLSCDHTQTFLYITLQYTHTHTLTVSRFTLIMTFHISDI